MELGKIIGVYEYVTFDGEAPVEEVPQTAPATPVEEPAPQTPVEEPELVPAQ